MARCVLLLLLAAVLLEDQAESSALKLPDAENTSTTLRGSEDAPNFLNMPVDLCGKKEEEEEEEDQGDRRLFFLFLVHTRPEDVERRMLVRQTWGSVRSLRGRRIGVVFLTGRSARDDPAGPRGKARRHFGSSDNRVAPWSSRGRSIGGGGGGGTQGDSKQRAESVQDAIDRESEQFGDILQGDFADGDSDDGRIRKHLMGLRWASDQTDDCRPVFVVKAEDDAFVEIFHLAKFVQAIYGDSPGERLLVCDVVPNGRSAVSSEAAAPTNHFGGGGGGRGEQRHQPRPRVEASSAAASAAAMAVNHDGHPEYCGETAYLMSPDLPGEFVRAAERVPNLSDESGSQYLTGRLRSMLGVSPFYLNLRYTRDPQACLRWLRGGTTLPMPYLFAGLGDPAAHGGDPGSDIQGRWKEIYRELWEKTVRVHQKGRD